MLERVPGLSRSERSGTRNDESGLGGYAPHSVVIPRYIHPRANQSKIRDRAPTSGSHPVYRGVPSEVRGAQRATRLRAPRRCTPPTQSGSPLHATSTALVEAPPWTKAPQLGKARATLAQATVRNVPGTRSGLERSERSTIPGSSEALYEDCPLTQHSYVARGQTT